MVLQKHLIRNSSSSIYFSPLHKLFHTNALQRDSNQIVTTMSSKKLQQETQYFDMSQFPAQKIRNFSIIAHIDHGKSTLADRLIKYFSKHSNSVKAVQFSDKLQVEKERGITVKAQTCALLYEYFNKETNTKETYLLNLIDTPGHVDFSYEVSRSLSACQAVLLLVDSSQGIQAQTLANYYLAFEQGLEIIPVITKIDQQTAQPELVSKDMMDTFGCQEEEILKISAKSGLNCDQVLPAIVQRAPQPKGDPNAILKALIFDSWFHEFHGVVCLIYVSSGKISVGNYIGLYSKFTHQQEQEYIHKTKNNNMSNKFTASSENNIYEVLGIGILNPEQTPSQTLYAGQVGYLVCGMKSTKEARIGDTIFNLGELKQNESTAITPLPGFKPSKPMVFAGIYPLNNADYERLRDSIEKLCLNDSSVTLSKETSTALGLGFRCGFLGLLHMDVFKQRLEQEFGTEVIITAPTVSFKIKPNGEEEKIIDNPNQLPNDPSKYEWISEPIVNAQIICPKTYMGQIMALCQDKRGEQQDIVFLTTERVSLHYKLPLVEIMHDFYDKLKSMSHGFASLEYEEAGFEIADMVKMNISLNGDPIDALSFIVHKTKAYYKGREYVGKLKDIISRQLFEVAIQASIGNKVIASERLKAFRKDVTAKCYGGDITRKRKLLEKQKEGKKRMKQLGTVEVPHDAFQRLFSSNPVAKDDE